MDEILCLNFKEMEIFVENFKFFFHENKDQQYSQPRLDAVDLKNVEAKDENPFTSIDLGSEFQQIMLKDYKNVNLLKNEHNEEGVLSGDLNRIRKFCPLTDQTRINGILENQYGHLNPPSKECELMRNRNSFPFILEKNLHINSRAASQETSSEVIPFSTKSSSVKTNISPANKNTYINGNEQPEGNLTEFLNFPESAVKSLHGINSLINKVSESFESTNDSNTHCGFSENNSNFIISQIGRLDFLSTPGMSAYKLKTDNSASRTSKKTYECVKCKELFFDRILFIRHYKFHSSKNLDVCSNSQKGMSCKDQLETHTVEKSFACNICEKIFSKNSSLVNHYKIHNKEQFVCDVCKKSFTQKRYLTQHYRMHANEKPFVCNKCGKGFKWKYSLVVHNRTHTGEKPYECDVCKTRFTQRNNLIYHYEGHTNEKPFGCDFCEKRFNHRRSVVLHRRKHTGEKS